LDVSSFFVTNNLYKYIDPESVVKATGWSPND